MRVVDFGLRIEFKQSEIRNPRFEISMPLDLHTIRLRGPWQLEPVERYALRGDGRCECSTRELPARVRATMPGDWSCAWGSEFLGRVRYRRTFHQPSGLEPHEKVFLVVEPARSQAVVSLDGRLLGELAFGDAPGRYEITPLLGETMRLEIVVSHPLLDERGMPTDDSAVRKTGGLVGEVRLEIEE